MTFAKLHAQPYDITASGFYFESLEEYEKKSAENRNDYGQPVEEYEIQFIDGNQWDHGQKALDCLGVELFLEIDATWDQNEITRLEIMIENLGAHYIPRDEYEIKELMEKCVFYFGSSKSDIASELFETYYHDLSKTLNDAGALWYFDEEKFVDDNFSGTFGEISGDSYYFEEI